MRTENECVLKGSVNEIVSDFAAGRISIFFAAFPITYHALLTCLPLAYHLLPMLLPFAYHLLTVSLPVPYHLLTICSPCITCAKLTARCEGSHLVVAGGCLPRPYHFFASSLPFPYHLLTMHYMCKIENKM